MSACLHAAPAAPKEAVTWRAHHCRHAPPSDWPPARRRLPCSNGVAWTFSKCDFDDFNGWADAADEALRAQGVALEKYKYRWGGHMAAVIGAASCDAA